MKTMLSRFLAAAILAAVAWVLLAGASASRTPLEPDKLVILSTTDVKGKTDPCG
jgi:hypothetical protein